MNRRTRHLVVLVVAVVTASIASFGVYRAVERMPARPAEAESVRVVVAARAMPIGTRITEKDVKVVAWPSGSQVPGAIGTVEEVVDRGLLAPVLENEPLTSARLAAADNGAGLPPAIPPGMRAISVRVNDVIGVAGFVVPGSRVDLVVTIRRDNDSMARTVASNVQVLTEGTRQQQEKPVADDETNATTVVTLVVTPQDAERIALAQTEGQIMLVLRNTQDQAPTVTAGVRTASLLGQAEATAVPAPAPKPAAPTRRIAAPAPAPEPPPPPPQRTVETIRAAKKSEEVIK
jgi:pilus assembly protein CpaB